MYQVSWVRRHDQELHLLTVGMQTYSTDSRFSLHFQQPNDYRLQIKYARPVDEGIYECQITMHPPRIYTVRLIVIGKSCSYYVMPLKVHPLHMMVTWAEPKDERLY